jgi:hypothetical protein
MTHEETVQLARYVKACCPQQQIDDYTPNAWYDLLGHLELAECREAAASVARRKPFVAPSEIIREVADARSFNEPHSNACRSNDHGDCRSSWCGCACHPENVRGITTARGGDPLQLGRGFDKPDSPWGDIDMGGGRES